MRAVAVLLSLVALISGVFVFYHHHGQGTEARGESSSVPSPAPPRGAPRLEERVAGLERKVDGIQTDLASILDTLRTRRHEAPAHENEPAKAVQESERSEELPEELAQLAQRLLAKEALKRERNGSQKSIDDLWYEALNASDEEGRLRALRALRGRRDANGDDARNYVLPEMIELARSSEDPMVRADVWRQLSHCTDPALRAPLLDSAANDAHASVREEAIETLADFLPDAQVEMALRYALENDPDPNVREQAAESLEELEEER